MEIEKKTWPELFEQILVGNKTFDARVADFECNEGDILVLKEWNPETKEYTGREIRKKVTYILKTKDVNFWSKEDIEKFGLQIISFKNED
ncbi:MAG: DUF3850 domain-containing protein [Candidatus Buchananbacteria bacterium]